MCELIHFKKSKSWKCSEHNCTLRNFKSMLKHLRRCSCEVDIRRPCDLGLSFPDGHGNEWYCFSCPGKKRNKDHRSFKSDEDLYQHIKEENHVDITYHRR